MIYTFSDRLLLRAPQLSSLLSSLHASWYYVQVNICKVSIYSMFLTYAVSRVIYDINDIKNLWNDLRY